MRRNCKRAGLIWRGAAIFLAIWMAAGCQSAIPSATIEWAPLNEPGSGGRISSIAISPHDSKQVYIGGDMLGIGRSQDGGETWQGTFGLSNWEINDFTFDPLDPAKIWVGTEGGPYVSTDGGIHWTMRRGGMGEPSNSVFTVPIQKIIYLHPGQDDQALIAFSGSHRDWTSGVNPGKTELGTIWKSADGGGTWKKVSAVPDDFRGKNMMGAYRAADGVLYVAVHGAGLYQSEDEGEHWRNTVGVAGGLGGPLPGEGRSVAWVTGDPQRADVVYAALTSYTSGRAADCSELSASAGKGGKEGKSGKAETCLHGGVFRSTNHGANWEALDPDGLNHRDGQDANQASSYEIVAVSQDGKTLYTSDSVGAAVFCYANGAWSKVVSGPNRPRSAFPAGPNMRFIVTDPRDPSVAYAGNTEYVLKTSDGGATWTDVTATESAPGSNLWNGRGFGGLVSKDIVFNPWDAKQTMLLAMDAGNGWLSHDSLRDWSKTKNPIPTWQGAMDASFSRSGGNGSSTIYLILGQRDFRGIGVSSDGGGSWKLLAPGTHQLPPQQGNTPGSIYSDPQDDQLVWAIVGGKLLATTDGGEHWSALDDGKAKYNWIAASRKNPHTFYVTSDRGVYRTKDGKQFDLIPENTVEFDRIAIDPNDDQVFYATRNKRTGAAPNGIFRYDGRSNDQFWSHYDNFPDAWHGKYVYDVDVDPF
ncbi:MAG: hypothetical protein K0R75_2831, partial [Paenibacillaceae bacterium]|nr:hypothetical protein [Paenibacillaceae bacterium]